MDSKSYRASHSYNTEIKLGPGKSMGRSSQTRATNFANKSEQDETNNDYTHADKVSQPIVQ